MFEYSFANLFITVILHIIGIGLLIKFISFIWARPYDAPPIFGIHPAIYFVMSMMLTMVVFGNMIYTITVFETNVSLKNYLLHTPDLKERIETHMKETYQVEKK